MSSTPRARLRGLTMAVMAGVLWALSGVAAQIIFGRYSVAPSWLAGVRMLGAGLILAVWLRPALPTGQWRRLVTVGVLGQAGMQFSYFAAIKASQVATATFLLSLSLPLIAVWEVLAGRARTSTVWWLGIGGAGVGAALLILAGSGGNPLLHASGASLAWGLASAAAGAYFVVGSGRVVTHLKLSVWEINCWSLALGGLALQVVNPIWAVPARVLDPEAFALCLFVVVVGTIAAGVLFAGSLRLVAAAEAGAAVTSQPVVAALVGSALLGVTLAPLQYAGGLLVVASIMGLSLVGRRRASHQPRESLGSVAAEGVVK